MSKALPVFCQEWHVTTSGAFRNLLFEPLEPHARLNLRPWDRTANSLGDLPTLAAAGPAIFCQAPPPRELAELPGARVAWVPMWDEVRTYHETVWAALPRTVRIVAFSRAVANLTTAMGFPTLALQYFVDPKRVEPASWSDGPVLYYWNRTGLFGPSFLARLCRSLGATRLLFRGQLDPRVSPNASYRLPSRLGGAAVTEVPATLPRDEYLRLVSSANVFLAPRACEGVGLMLLEALAWGQAAFACDVPAMNEYITHGEDGVLLRLAPPSNGARRSHKRLGWLGARKPVERPNADLVPATRQDWKTIAALDLQALGRQARQRHEVGFKTWNARIPELARFLLEW